MKKIKKVLGLFAVGLFVPVACLFSGCSFGGNEETAVYIVSITKTTTSEGDAFDITYSDGSTEYFLIGKAEDGKDGKNGKDGKSIVSINKTGQRDNVDIYTIVFSDDTKTTFEIKNGKDGKDGQDGKAVVSVTFDHTEGLVDYYKILFTDGSSTIFDITNGKDGTDGTNGTDGKSVLSITKTGTDGNVDTYTIMFSDGTNTTFEITNGTDGKDGINGKDGKDGKAIVSISKTDQNGLIDIYTITYSDTTTSTFEVKNGSLSIADAYEEYVTRNGSISYEDFLALYLTNEEDSNVKAINNCLLSSLKVYTEFKESTETAVFSGSAVIYKMDVDYSYIVTNYHVVYDEFASLTNNGGTNFPLNIYGYLYGSEDYPTKSKPDGFYTVDYGDYGIKLELIGGSASSDIAVLRVETDKLKDINPQAKAIEMADEYHVGENVYAIGNTLGEGISVTEGVVSVDSENIILEVDGSSRNHRVMRIDTYINHGNSGGGLFNKNGKLVGITNSGSGLESENYAIPLEVVQNVADNIIHYFEDGNDSTNGANKVLFGIQVVETNSKYVLDASTGYGRIETDVILTSVSESSIAKNCGLQVGDVLEHITINGVKHNIYRGFNIGDLAVKIKLGDVISFGYVRSGNPVQETVPHTVNLITILG